MKLKNRALTYGAATLTALAIGATTIVAPASAEVIGILWTRDISTSQAPGNATRGFANVGWLRLQERRGVPHYMHVTTFPIWKRGSSAKYDAVRTTITQGRTVRTYNGDWVDRAFLPKTRRGTYSVVTVTWANGQKATTKVPTWY